MLNRRSDKGFRTRRKEEIVKLNPSPKNLPQLVFVVQFHAPAEPGSARFAGRAEHIMSGENARFQTPKQLIDFFKRVRNEVEQ